VKVLFLAPQYPFPPHQGTTIRNLHLLRYLTAHHDVHLLTFASPLTGQPQTADDPLPDLCSDISCLPHPRPRSLTHRALATLSSPLPDMALRLESAIMHKQVDHLVRAGDFDVVQIEGIEMAPFGLDVARQRSTRRPLLVFDDHNAEYVLQRTAYQTDRRKPRRWVGAAYSWVQWKKLQRYEAHCCQTFDRTVAVSDTDATALRTLRPALPVIVLPNGVDTGAFCPSPLPEHPEPLLVFTGKMDFRPNVDAMLWFTNQILPRVLRLVPEARLNIVGQSPHKQLRHLADDPRLAITGYVPDVRPYIAAAAIFVVPLRMGGGTRLKVLEAMAMGKAIVSTPLGCEGLEVTPGKHVLLAETPTDFADQIIALLNDPVRARLLGQQARDLVEARYAWSHLTPALEDVMRGA